MRNSLCYLYNIIAFVGMHFLISNPAYAMGREDVVQSQSGAFSIQENKGQWHEDAKYAVTLSKNSMLYVTAEGLVYDIGDSLDADLTAHMVKNDARDLSSPIAHRNKRRHCFLMSLEGAEGFNKIEPQEEVVTKYHYYLGPDSKDWHTNVRSYNGILIRDVYPGIDFKLYLHNGALKYDFIVGAGVDYRIIRVKYKGVTVKMDDGGNLFVQNSVMDLVEEAPIVYQVSKAGDTVYLASKYHLLSEDQVTYTIQEAYDSSIPLIIDPKIVFATFSGGGGLAYASTYNHNGDFYAMSDRAVGAYTYRRVFGQYQVDSLWDNLPIGVGINKFNADGSKLLHSILIKGSGIRTPSCLNVDEHNNLYVGLLVWKPNDDIILPNHANMYIAPASGGKSDIYLCKISEQGDFLMGAAVIGGSGWEGDSVGSGNEEQVKLELKILKNGNVALVSNTNSDDYITTSDAIHPSYLGGSVDGVFTVLDQDLTKIIYSTYLGGSQNDYCLDIIETDQEEIVIGGTSNSIDLKIVGNNVLQPLKNEGYDGFVVKFNKYYEYLNASYIGGAGNDVICKLGALKDGSIHALIDYPNYKTSADAHNWTINDGFKIFKIDGNLQGIRRSVAIGKMVPTAFMVDVCGNSYVSGVTRGGPLTKDAIKEDGGMWLGIYSEDFSVLKFGTMLGTIRDHYHNGVIRFDPLGIIYQIVCTSDEDYPATTNAAYPKKESTGVELVAIKIDSEVKFVKADIFLKDEDRIGCTIPFKVTFNNNSVSRENITYSWDFGDSSIISSDKQPTHTYTQPGKYTVVLTASAPGTCNGLDRDTVEILVYDLSNTRISLPDIYLCKPTDSLRINAVVNFPLFERMKVLWEPAAGILSGQGTLSPLVSPAVAQQYSLSIEMKEHCPFSVSENGSIYNAVIAVKIDTSYSCFNKDNGSIAVTKLSADTFGYEYVWTDSVGDTLSRDDKISGLKGGDYGLWVSNGHCDTLYSISIATFEGRVRFDNPQYYWCQVDRIELDNHSDAYYQRYNWYVDDKWVDSNFNFDRRINELGAHKVQLIGVGEKCTDTSAHHLSVDAVVHFRFELSRDSICVGERITFMPIPGSEATVTEINWSLGNQRYLSDKPEPLTYGFDDAGNIPVTLTAKFRACPDTNYSRNVPVYPLPKVFLGSEHDLCYKGQSITLQNLVQEPDGYSTFLWSTGDTTAAIEVTVPGTYSVAQSDQPLGCTGYESIEIAKSCFIDVPNAFTPNGDGVNDYFFPRQYLSRSVATFKLQIYNRWGQIVYETNSTEGKGWDGRFNGKEQPQGVYIYRVEIAMPGLQREVYEASITLIR